MSSIPASDASTLAYLAEFPDTEAVDQEKLLEPLGPEARQIADALLGRSNAASPQIQEKADALKEWGVQQSSLR